ncbi:MAG: type IX secretion system PorP/SprF family membrane protein [Salibacteraceae bacterium]|jgi:type IX secretion system PorP/SprF family membrane protein
MIKKILVFIGFVGSFGLLQAQQDPQFTVGQYHGLAYQNPAVVGSHDAICATMVGRLQWVGFGGEPSTFMFSAQSPFEIGSTSHGVGLTVMSDQLGQETTMVAKLQYAYKLNNIGPGTLSLGLGLGYISKSLGSDWIASQGIEDDPSIPINGASEGGLDLDFGVFYKIPKKLTIGISSTHLSASKFNSTLEDKVSNGDARQFNYQIDRTFYVSAQYEQVISDDGAWVLKPGIFVKSDLASTVFSIGALAEYEERFFGGLHYRVQDAVALMLGANFQMNGENAAGGMLKVGYSYDFTTSNVRNFSSGSHELFVRYCFSISSQPKEEEHHTVRFL